ncbi:hypothetical protein DM01DRAFT_1341085 [Hesseltinella vesiculosa]|uniref:Uncharacterized protein n=1 Tax=Hesseltinella vesiculosa TaxID=101127 RepID=A0A1X2G249_9FUNG|nr:hypothetical protein DM01DRAFT_1341085 [Hesseltinella vesiculosa]
MLQTNYPSVRPPLPGISAGAEHVRDMLGNLHHLPIKQQRFVLRLLIENFPMEPLVWILAIELW